MSGGEAKLIAHLQRQVEQLEATVAARSRELEVAHRELEQRVDARTRELAAALERAEAASAAKQAFLAHMSHELRTPLHAINGMAGVLLAGATGEHERRLGVIGAAGAHMLRLVNQILDLSWLSRDEMPMQLEAVAVAQIVDEVVAACDVPAAQKGLRVRACVDAVPPFLLADAMRLREVLLNFLGNAVKFTQQGLVSLHVASAEVDSEHVLDWVVEDSGCGMDAATVARVFEPFFQAKDTYRREHGGAGLGMAIARRIVQAMGGDVTVESEPGVGTRVRFTTRHGVPALAADEPADARRGAAAVRGRRVLVIDDQEANCLVAEAVLAQLGCAAVVTQLPADGIARARREPFDLLLVDYHMPGIDGCEVVARLRGAGVRVPMLLATADLTAGALEVAATAGCDGVIGKPFSAEELGARMAQALGAHGEADAMEPPAPAPATAAARPEATLFDAADALARLGGNRKILTRVLGVFLASLPESLAALRAGGGDVRQAAHALKGSAGSVSAKHLAELARAVEGGEQWPLASGDLERAAAATAAAIRAWLGQ